MSVGAVVTLEHTTMVPCRVEPLPDVWASSDPPLAISFWNSFALPRAVGAEAALGEDAVALDAGARRHEPEQQVDPEREREVVDGAVVEFDSPFLRRPARTAAPRTRCGRCNEPMCPPSTSTHATKQRALSAKVRRIETSTTCERVRGAGRGEREVWGQSRGAMGERWRLKAAAAARRRTSTPASGSETAEKRTLP